MLTCLALQSYGPLSSIYRIKRGYLPLHGMDEPVANQCRLGVVCWVVETAIERAAIKH